MKRLSVIVGGVLVAPGAFNMAAAQSAQL